MTLVHPPYTFRQPPGHYPEGWVLVQESQVTTEWWSFGMPYGAPDGVYFWAFQGNDMHQLPSNWVMAYGRIAQSG